LTAPTSDLSHGIEVSGPKEIGQNDICTRKLRATRCMGSEISASISFAQTWLATFDVNSRRIVSVRPLMVKLAR
jgi:hypothetical protein